MIRNKADLEKIKQKVAPLLYLRSPNPAFKLIFHYNPENRSLGIDELVTYTIEKLQALKRLDCVVLRVFQVEASSTITMSVVEKDKTTLYHKLSPEIIDQIIQSHLQEGQVLKKYVVKTVTEESL